ncbi:HD-GYP domain-containing protein [Caloranaerobacter azorensis]|uniref:HD-GYP domain-containing protein n=1 Tax=Caloranaerobacter azorensis TaxID=116090 RepID=A0A6P1YF04_9FIRM|nr:HD-GYP domain-containing protein [Caloranaerobacter azorensis]QIB27338.1 HD-GYP domain-containing protein [Caloranaerobacter azorensis]
MRFMPVVYVREGAKLGKHIYDDDGRILLKKGATLTKKILNRINEMGIRSVYIDDEFSDTELEDIIKPELRNKAISAVKETFAHFEKFSRYISENPMQNKHQIKKLNQKKDEYLQFLGKISEEIINDILSNKHVIVNLIDIKSTDNYTYQHCINVAVLSLVLGIEMKLNKGELKNLCLGAMLHDIGKTIIPKEILLKNGKLTKEEFEIIKEHTTKGYDYLKTSIDIPGTARIITLQHHEKVDGSGYPQGLSDSEINKLAKIVAIADVYDALTSDRPYRQAMPPNEALEYIYANGGSHFDFEMVKTFSSKIIPYPIGTLIKLSNGEIAVVEDIIPNFPLRPKIRIISNHNEKVIDLMKEKNLVITGIQYEAPAS